MAIFSEKPQEYVIGRAYSFKPFKDIDLDRPRAVILLSQGQTGKNKKMCEAFVDGLPPVEDILKYSSSKALPTYWLLSASLDTSLFANCKALLANYNYKEAKVLMATFGRANSAGPLLVAQDSDGEFLAIDFSQANAKDMRTVLATWFSTPPLDGKVVSKTIWGRLSAVVCGLTTSTATELEATNPDPSKAGTFIDFGDNVLRKVNIWSVGAMIVVRTFNAALCPSQQSA